MAVSFFALNVKCNSGYCDEHGDYHPMVHDDPYVICYCETQDDAVKMLKMKSRTSIPYDWLDLIYYKEEKNKITKRYGEYDKRKHRYAEGMETTWWITEIEFTKPN